MICHVLGIYFTIFVYLFVCFAVSLVDLVYPAGWSEGVFTSGTFPAQGDSSKVAAARWKQGGRQVEAARWKKGGSKMEARWKQQDGSSVYHSSYCPGPRIVPSCHPGWGAVSDLGGSFAERGFKMGHRHSGTTTRAKTAPFQLSFHTLIFRCFVLIPSLCLLSASFFPLC